MADDLGTSLTLETVDAFADIGRDAWETLAGTRPGDAAYNPFISYAFLGALEESGSATKETGWIGSHLLAKDSQGTLLGAVPAYLKLHSQGEYVFDHAWADAFERAGGRYYPKLQASIPFTPASAPKLLIPPEGAGTDTRRVLAAGMRAVVDRLALSSAHVTFVSGEEQAVLDEAGYLTRHDQQFHWTNRGYGSFAAFEEELASRKRKQLRRERREALSSGITVRWLSGSDLREEHWDAFFRFYQDTGSRKWGRPYLTRSFFSLIGQSMAGSIVLMLAYRGGKPVAGALSFRGADALYGRHWGCVEHHPFLHFELCYYQAIDYAIAHGLARVEAGAQGAHKLARGYEPVVTTSMHYIPHAGFRRAVEDYLSHEREQVLIENLYLEERTPFRKGD